VKQPKRPIRNIRDYGEWVRGAAGDLALRLEEYGADANRYILTNNHRGDNDVITIPAALADVLHAVLLSLVPGTRGRPPKRSTTEARKLLEVKFSKRDASRLLASVTTRTLKTFADVSEAAAIEETVNAKMISTFANHPSHCATRAKCRRTRWTADTAKRSRRDRGAIGADDGDRETGARGIAEGGSRTA
jgi:hypothetical protein